MIKLAKYQFSSWARRGIGANIQTVDDLGVGTATTLERAQIPFSVQVNTENVSKNFTLYGPGDITGLNSSMVVRTQPRNWITDYEPNYLAFLEFYDEDYPWRYTPARAQGEKLRPWIVLLVLKTDEFERGERRIPLPSIIIKDGSSLPSPDETWMWAHVHNNHAIDTDELSDYEEFLLSLNQTTNDDPDQIFSRLICPRRLEPDTDYYAIVAPAFETGRKAGLELATENVLAQLPSWQPDSTDLEMPVYYEWFFRTGKNEDFEYLVKLLQPREVDPQVGIRPMDCTEPGFSKVDGSGPVSSPVPDIIGLEGALKSPQTESTLFPDPAGDNQFQNEVRDLVNINDSREADLNADPLVTIPFYGHKHVLVETLNISDNGWVHELNRDPRHRVASGFGTKVVQKHQERYMQKAWRQVESILEANRKLREARASMAVADKIHRKVLKKLPAASLLGVSQPVLPKVMGSPTTVFHQLSSSRLANTPVTGSFRRMLRPQGPALAKRLQPSGYSFQHLIEQINEDEVSPAPPKVTGKGLPSTRDLADRIFRNSTPRFIRWILSNALWIFLVLLVLIVVLAIISTPWLGFLVIPLIAAYQYSRNQQQKMKAAQSLDDRAIDPEAVADIPARPTFSLQLDHDLAPVPPTAVPGSNESLEAANFRVALRALHTKLSFTIDPPVYQKFDIKHGADKVLEALRADIAFPRKLRGQIQLPEGIDLMQSEKIFPVMAYPDIEEPMYKKLTEFSSELLIPNLKLVPNNTISLLETNQKFIESYMVGLNHEMSRELMWREYPTDERGSYFRQFWDVNGLILPSEESVEINSERFKDIKPIHKWGRRRRLGTNNNRDEQGDETQLVLLIRGDLLKRYPNTLIFAQKAEAGANTSAPLVIDTDLDDTEFMDEVKFPLYKAEVEPDVKMFGFDLTIEQALGTELTPGFGDDLGWFFVIQEIPGEPRFGMDIQTTALTSWDDLSWGHFDPQPDFINVTGRPQTNPSSDNSPDRWGVNSAEMAYILYQKPVMVAVHAKEMLDS